MAKVRGHSASPWYLLNISNTSHSFGGFIASVGTCFRSLLPGWGRRMPLCVARQIFMGWNKTAGLDPLFATVIIWQFFIYICITLFGNTHLPNSAFLIFFTQSLIFPTSPFHYHVFFFCNWQFWPWMKMNMMLPTGSCLTHQCLFSLLKQPSAACSSWGLIGPCPGLVSVAMIKCQAKSMSGGKDLLHLIGLQFTLGRSQGRSSRQ